MKRCPARKTVVGLLLPSILACITACGCIHPRPATIEQPKPGRVFMLTGVGGHSASLWGVQAGLQEAGVARRFEIVSWAEHPFGAFKNLKQLKVNRGKAAAIADQITRAYRDCPGGPITLIGYSGGGGMVIFVAEALPDDVVLDRIILIAAALSPQYDLTRAMSRTRRGMVNFYSSLDWFMLGWSTRIHGTMDRRQTDSAGRVGFQDDQGHLRELEGLVQVPWQLGWWFCGNDGGHWGWLAKPWACKILASYVTLAAPATGPW